MQVKTKKSPLWQYDMFRPVDWRSQNAHQLAKGERINWASEDDPDVTQYAEFLRADGSTTSPCQRVAVRERWPEISRAHDLFEKNSLERWEIQDRILAGQSDAEIAARCQVSANVVALFERLFFFTRHCLDATGYLIIHVIGKGSRYGYRNDELSNFLTASALSGGPKVLDFLLDSLRSVLRPGEEPLLSVYLRAKVPLNLQASAAVSVLPLTVATAHVSVALGCQLAVAAGSAPDQKASELEKLKKTIVRYAQLYLAGKPLPMPKMDFKNKFKPENHSKASEMQEMMEMLLSNLHKFSTAPKAKPEEKSAADGRSGLPEAKSSPSAEKTHPQKHPGVDGFH